MDNLNIASPTLADIYLQQGHIEAAIDIYDKLVRKEPANDLYRKRLAALKKELKAKGKTTGFKKILKKKIW
ncbi:MAG: tetratricopeptide repeat protein [Syntrophorhabdaceae bacterium]|jgi:cytochrome c-type biogenesis protein CcmH/NrfG|nr:tetratricopeptide repeat protein [Syntrophorhabdaceae bacterium]MDD5244283.1 tetratricopeptide repeat protein [Syntrophorhabdaceae bacterium]